MEYEDLTQKELDVLNTHLKDMGYSLHVKCWYDDGLHKSSVIVMKQKAKEEKEAKKEKNESKS